MEMTRHGAARLGGTLYVISGLLVIANNYAPAADHLNRQLLATIGSAAIVLGLITWFLVPWDRLPARATLVLPVVGLSLVGLANAAGGVSEPSYGVFFILIGAYIGATQARWMTLVFAPFMVLVYVGALLYRGDASQASIWAVTVVIPVAVIVGEVLAGALHDLAAAQARAERRSRLLSITARATRTVGVLDTRKVLEALADAALELGYEGVSLEVFESDGTYRVMEARGLPASFSGSRHPRDSGITGEVERTRRQVVLESYASDPRALAQLRDLGFVVVIGTPVLLRDEIVAVLNVGARRAIEVEASELEALELLADQAGHALDLAGMFERERRDSRRYRREALLDALTGLGNRRRAEQLLDTTLPGDIIGMLDLDDFKTLNDAEGHTVGDRVLAALGAFLRTSLRGGDVAARYGGEEFLLIIRGSGHEAHTIAERLRVGWVETRPPVTLSIGTAVLAEGEAPRDALARADGALFAAKAAGKNCVRHANGGEVIDLSTRRSRG